MKKINLSLLVFCLLLTSAFLTSGCNMPQASSNLKRFSLINPSNLAKEITQSGEVFVVYEDNNYGITLALYEYNGFFALPLEITNKTSEEVKGDEYDITLCDGRDLLPLKRFSCDDRSSMKPKDDNSASLSLSNISVGGVISSVNSVLDLPADMATQQQIHAILTKYFCFRPLYPHEKRYGFLVFYHKCPLDYPETLTIKIKKDKIVLYFDQRTSAPPSSHEGAPGKPQGNLTKEVSGEK